LLDEHLVRDRADGASELTVSERALCQVIQDQRPSSPGGNSGIGLASARRFVSEGAFVFITGRRQDDLDKAAAEIGHDVRALQGDVSKLDDLDRMLATIREAKERLDIVFANAGIAETAPLGSITEASFDKLFDINVKGMLFTVQKALPLMRAGGSII
jgi:NAD(P)-dependent dehydrogenase (short-subunit alcohol dehydrogenase family)